jgi:spoIIIJ-associated protein
MTAKSSGRDDIYSVEAKGKSVEKALKKALKKMGASINEVEVEIEDPGEKGILGIFGSRDAKVRVLKKEKNAGVEEVAEEITEIIMNCLEVNYRIFSDMMDDSTYINIETAGVDGLLIGRKGDTLNSLQHLVGRIVSKKLGGYRRLTLDVGGYLKNRYDLIRKKASKAADRARCGQGATLVECKTYRLSGHSRGDQRHYRSRDEEDRARAADPIPRLQEMLAANGILSEADDRELRKEAHQVVAEAVAFAEKSDYPDPATLAQGIFA